MAGVGLVITLVGFLIAATSVGMMTSTAGRLILVLAGIVISLFGIIGVVNQAYQKDAVWKR